MTHGQILQRYFDLLAHNRAKSLFAVESGSRAWGFESATSDYDVRFIYWMPQDWYLSIESKRDVIEEIGDDDLDFAGWDVRKALGLAYKSNPSLHDWLVTDIIYHKDDQWFPEFHDLALEYFRPNACIQHYRSLANTNYLHFQNKTTIPYKKYFYVLRALMCERHIQETHLPAPSQFGVLLDRNYPSGPIREEIDRLLVLKKEGEETAISTRVFVLDHEIERLLAQPLPKDKLSEPKSKAKLDDYFRRIVAS